MKCFYCELEEPAHRDGCPHKIYREESEKVFGGCKSNVEVVSRALSTSSGRIDAAADEAIRQFERGYDDGNKISSARHPSNHPSYKLGLSRALVAVTAVVALSGEGREYLLRYGEL